MDAWKNRIIGHGVKPASEFLVNPWNFRVHAALQQGAMDGILAEVGWIAEVIENVTTGHLVDGHLRVSRAYLRDASTPVPVQYVELTEAEERLALKSFDWLTSLFERQADMLSVLLQQTRANDARVETLLLPLRTPLAPPPPPDGSTALLAVRPFSLLMESAQYDIFLTTLSTLAARYETTNATDTILAALRDLRMRGVLGTPEAL